MFACQFSGTLSIVDTVKLLLDWGAKVNIKGHDDWTALNYTIYNFHKSSLDTFTLLLDQGADPNNIISNKKDPLYQAIEILSNLKEEFKITLTPIYMEAIKLLLTKGAKNNVLIGEMTHLHFCASSGQTAVVILLLDNGYDVNVPDINGTTPLHYAIFKDRRAMVKLLLDRGANINIGNKNGWNALHYAARYSARTIKLIINDIININSSSNDGETALHLFLNNNNKEKYLLFLLDKGADPNIQTEKGATPLYLAVMNKSVSMVKLLLDRGADVNIKSKNGTAAIHSAVHSAPNNPESSNMIELLLNSGATLEALDNRNCTPLMWSISSFKGVYIPLSITELLLDKGANVNAQNIDGSTPLMYAVNNKKNPQSAQVISLLLARGADLDLKDKNGNKAKITIYHTAVIYGPYFL